jgi:hypothetical protein
MTQPEDTRTMEAQFHAMDDALSSGTAKAEDPLERELQELALALQGESATPAPEFEAELRERVEKGFPRERRLHLPALPRLPRPPLPVLGGVASVLVAIAVAVSLIGGGDESGPELRGGPKAGPDLRGGPVKPQASAPGKQLDRTGGGATAAPTESSPAPDLAPTPAPRGRGFAPGARERRIERSASLTLAAPEDHLDRVAGGINRLTDRYDGFVLRSSLASGDEGTTGGDFELRIPADRLQSALADLSKLADVRARSQSGEDVTPQFVSAQERLQGARAERRSLLRRLERAPNDAAAEAIRRRLDLNAGEIRGLRSSVRELRARTDYASVTVTLTAKGGNGGASSPGSGQGLGGALDDALGSLSGSVELAIRLLGVMLPLGMVSAALALGARAFRRRRREAALG